MESSKIELRSLNQELPVLYAEELEMRLETDPLAVGSLLDEIMMLACNGNSGNCGSNTADCSGNSGSCGENGNNCTGNSASCGTNR